MEKELIRDQLLEFEPKTSFTVISKGRVVNIGFAEISHIRKFGSEVIVYASNREYRTKYSLQDIMNELPVNDFFRIHKSHIVSLKHIDGIKRNRVQIGNTFLEMSNYYYCKAQMIAELARQLNQLIEFHSRT